MVIAIDFDGTCVTHEYPKVGKDIGAAKVLKKLVENGHKLILWTMRCDFGNLPIIGTKNEIEEANYLQDAINWFKENDIPLYGIQNNPEQHSWTKSPKAYAQLYIDDAALGCPLKYNKSISNRPFVDWIEIEKLLYERRVLLI